MTDATHPPQPKQPEQPAQPPSIRKGSPKDIAISAYNRKKPYYVESFVSYLKSLEDDQQSIHQRKKPRQETLDQQLDMLDAMFTYLSVHADWKGDSHLIYSAALRSQKQFCSTLREMHQLKFSKPAKSSSPTFPLDKKIGVPHGARMDN